MLAILVAGGGYSKAEDGPPAQKGQVTQEGAAQEGAASQNGMPSAPRETRLAFVVGEAGYASAPLPVGANDAGLVAQALSQVGFEVTARADLDGAALRKLAQDFAEKVTKAGPDAFVVVYLAGAGVQFGNDNFILPIDANVARAGDIPSQAVALDDLLHPLDMLPARARLFIADLARRPPLAGRDLPLAAGLALREPVAAGTLVAFNAMPGTLAPANPPPYGAYARALAAAILTPGQPIDALFERVRLRVGAATNGAAIPWNTGSPEAGLAFVPPVARDAPETGAPEASDIYSSAIVRDTLLGYDAAIKAAPNGRQAPRLRTVLAALREARFWGETAKSNDPRAYWTYLRRYPHGAHLFDARHGLALLKAALEPPPRFDIVTYDAAPAPTADEAVLVAAPFALLANPAWPLIPPPPDGSLPPATLIDLPPPPLVPAGVLPIPLLSPARSGGSVRRIVQPDVPGYGSVVSETRGGAAPSLALFANGKPLCRTATLVGSSGDRSVTETDGGGAVVSRTTIEHRHGETTILQTGPDGGTLITAVTRLEQDGTRRTLVTDGRRQVLADVRTDEGGVVVASTLGSLWDIAPAFKPAAAPGQSPTLLPRAVAAPKVVSADAPPPRPLAAGDPPPLPPVTFPTTEPPPAAKPSFPPIPPPAPKSTAASVAAPPPAKLAASPRKPERPAPAPPPRAPEPPRKKSPAAAANSGAKAPPRKAERPRPAPARRPSTAPIKKHR